MSWHIDRALEGGPGHGEIGVGLHVVERWHRFHTGDGREAGLVDASFDARRLAVSREQRATYDACFVPGCLT